MTFNSKQLSKKLNYQFKDEKLLKSALTHRSIQTINNERLEFLGDAIVNFLVAELLFSKYPKAREGELSRFRAYLVKGETLAELATTLEIGKHLQLGVGEAKTGGHLRESILADAMEAVIAAIYLDGGLEACRDRVYTWFEKYVTLASNNIDFKDPKTRLQEYLQAHKLPLPTYTIISRQGDAHQQTFHIKCAVTGVSHTTKGSGSSRRRAEQESAEKYLNYLEVKWETK